MTLAAASSTGQPYRTQIGYKDASTDPMIVLAKAVDAELFTTLVPTFFVPLFVMLHIASLLQAGHSLSTGMVCSWTEPTIQCRPVESGHKA